MQIEYTYERRGKRFVTERLQLPISPMVVRPSERRLKDSGEHDRTLSSRIMTDRLHTCARFWKCALQVNPSSYSTQYRGQEQSTGPIEYAEALRDACIDQDVQVVGLADHGNVQDSATLREVLTSAGITVFPGFEVATTERVHWVCLFPEETSEAELERYLGTLRFSDPRKRTGPSTLGGNDLLAAVEDLGGFCYAAHATGPRNGLLTKKGLQHIWKDKRLRAAQIPGLLEDLPQKYKQIVLNKNADYRRDREIALINAKDVTDPDVLMERGTSCYIKMTAPCFSSFVVAFKDAQSRVRISLPDEQHYSQIIDIKIEGAYFTELSTNISEHLNAIIGGRGTGKSTVLECLRYALNVPHKGSEAALQGDQIVKENLGGSGGRVKVRLRSAANNSEEYTVIRRFGENPRVIDKHGNESSLDPNKDLVPQIEIYGQNEIHELVRDPESLTRVLDRFYPEIDGQELQLKEAYRMLKENSEQLKKAHFRKDQIEARIADLPKLEERAKQFQEHGLEAKLRIVPLLEKERLIGPRIEEEVRRVQLAIQGLTEALPDLVFLGDSTIGHLPHVDLLKKARTELEHLDQSLRQKISTIEDIIKPVQSNISGIIENLNAELQRSEEMLIAEFAKLPSVAGRTGRQVGQEYQKLLRAMEEVKPERAKLRSSKELVAHLNQKRRNLLGEISDLRSERTLVKQKAVKKLSKRLKGMLRITLKADSLRRNLLDFIQGLEGVGPQRSRWVKTADGLTVMGLVAAIHEGRDALLEKGWGITSSLADTLARLDRNSIHQLESIDLNDELVIELNVSHTGETYRPLDRLSTGQQCTAILHLLLLRNRDPLVMDQPEDNLDNAFIAERIVDELRKAKTERQFLFATHNANIPVFGDAEWIGVCEASEDHAEMPASAQGSIDIPEIRDRVANILEGGREAFLQRKEKYGFDY